MSKTGNIIGVGAILIAGIVTAGWLYLGQKKRVDNSADSSRRVVKLVRVMAEEKRKRITYPGRVRPVKHAELFFRVSGPVIERNLKYGQTVEAGTVLMRIDPRDYQREVDRLTQELEVQKVQNSLANIEYNRNRKLIESKAVSQAVYDAAATKKQASDAQLKMLEVALRIAKDKLSDTVLIAPFHGTVSDLKIEQYEIAAANVPVVTLDDLREVEIRISVPAGNLPNSSIYDGKRYLGMKFDVTFPGRGDKVLQAAIYEFKPVAFEESETYEVTLRTKVPDDFLVLPGMSAEVHGVPQFSKDCKGRLKLPFSAVFKRDGKASVWIYRQENKNLEMRQIRLGEPADGDMIFIEDGVKPGDYVVAAGGDWLTDGTSVRILNPEVFHENH